MIKKDLPQLDNTNKLQAPWFKQDRSKSKVRLGLASTVRFVVAMENTTKPWYRVFRK